MTDLQLLEKALEEELAKGDKKSPMRVAGLAAAMDDIIANSKAAPVIADVASRAKAGTAEYVKDKIRQGPGDAVQTLDLIGNILGSPSKLFTEPKQTIADAAKVSQEDRRPVDEFFGAQNRAPDSLSTRIIGAGAGMISDPTTYFPPGGGILRKGASAILPGMFGEGALSVAEKLDVGPLGEIGAAVVGGGVGGAVNSGLGRAGRAGAAIVSGYRSGKVGGMVDMANQKLLSQAEQHVKNTINDAMKADPDLIPKIMKLQEEAKLVGKELPLHAIGNNPVIKAAISTLARKDPTFAGLYARKYDDAIEALSTSQGKVFGDPTTAAARLQGELKEPKAAQLERIQGKLDDRAFEAGKPMAPFFNDQKLSVQLKRRSDVVDAPHNISPRSTPLYDAAIDSAEANKDALTPASVDKIASLLRSEKAENPFSKFPTLWETVQKKLRLVDEPARVFSDSGAIPQVVKQQTQPLNFAQVFDLKEAISTEYRRLNPNAPDYWTKRAELTKLRQAVDEGIQADFNPETVALRKKADTQYAFDFTLKDISREAFNEKGQLNPKAVMKWLENPKNQSALNNLEDIDGVSLKELVANPSIAVAKIMEKKDSVNGIYGRMNLMRVLDASQMTPNQIKARMAEDPKFTGQFLKTYGKNSDALMALRSIALDDIMQSPEPLVDLLKNKDKAQMYARVFGPDYKGHIENLASLSQRLAKNPADVGFDFKNAISKDRVDELIRVPVSQIFSKLRNPIMSKWQAIVELGSKAMTARAEDAYEQSMKRIILDPAFLAEYAKAIKPVGPSTEVDPNKLLALAKKYGLGEVQNTAKQAKRGAFLGLQQGIINEVNPPDE